MKKLFLFMLLFSTYAHATQNSYTCIVKSASSVSDKGDISSFSSIKKSNDQTLSQYIDTVLHIEKRTGVVKGNIISNQTPNASKTNVLNDSNDGKTSYQVLSLFAPNTSILYIRVNDNLVTTVREISFDGYFRGVYITGLCE